jgi:hypothetical protein
MIYTLQHGVRKTLSDRVWKGMEYGVVGVSGLVLALFIGNIWYAANYNPGTSQPGTGQPATSPIHLTTAGVTQPNSNANTAIGPVASSAKAVGGTRSPGWTYSVAPTTVQPAPQSNDSPVAGGMGGGPVDTGAGSGQQGGGDNGGTTGSDTGSGSTSGGSDTTGSGGDATDGDDAGSTGVSVPPIDIPVPLVTVTTPTVSLGL